MVRHIILWRLKDIGDKKSDLRTWSHRAPCIVIMPGLARFAYNKEMSRQDLVNVFRAGLADRDVEEFVPTPRSILQPNFAGRLMARIATPAFKDIRRDLRESLFALRAARTAVAIRRYGRANGGEIPSDLSALVPTYLAEVPRANDENRFQAQKGEMCLHA